MNWTMVLVGFALAVMMGAAAAALLRQYRPQWNRRKRVFVAASILPVFTLLATIAGVILIKTSDHGATDTMEDLAVATVATIGGDFVFLAFVAGLIGAGLSQRRNP